MDKRLTLKPQDVLVLFAVFLASGREWVIAEIANRACLSISETHAAIRRLEVCRLLDPVSRRVIIAAAEEFVLHGLKYVFPAELEGKTVRGMPTAHSALPLVTQVVSDATAACVWPCAYGQSRGMSVIPLYKTVPDAAQKDPRLYELLSLADALCMGRVREQELAAKMLVERLRGEMLP
jgi:hypothetical protein